MAAAMAMAGTCTGCKRSFEEMEKLIIHHAYCLEPANEEEKRNFENVRQHWAQVNSSDSNKKKFKERGRITWRERKSVAAKSAPKFLKNITVVESTVHGANLIIKSCRRRNGKFSTRNNLK